jgi:hypothetical protein
VEVQLPQSPILGSSGTQNGFYREGKEMRGVIEEEVCMLRQRSSSPRAHVSFFPLTFVQNFIMDIDLLGLVLHFSLDKNYS